MAPTNNEATNGEVLRVYESTRILAFVQQKRVGENSHPRRFFDLSRISLKGGKDCFHQGLVGQKTNRLLALEVVGHNLRLRHQLEVRSFCTRAL